MSARTRLAPLALAAVTLFVACSNDPAAAVPNPCESVVSSCVAKQQACVADGASARREPCAAGEYASLAGKCEPIGGATLAHAFAECTTQPGGKVLGLCQSWTLNNAEEMWVNAVALDQDEASHHSNWTFVLDDQFDGPNGV